MIKSFALAAALLSSATAFADVSIRFDSRDAGDPALTTSLTANYITGGLNYTNAATGSFQAYCIEPDQSFAITSRGFKTYTVGSFSGTQGTLLQALYSSSFGSVHDGAQQAGFQLAVWEIMREASGTLSLAENNGNFFLKTAGLTGAQLTTATGAQTFASSYLAAAQAYHGASLYSLTKLSNANYQDLVVATPTVAVPEPESYALLLAGLGAIGMIARRRLTR